MSECEYCHNKVTAQQIVEIAERKNKRLTGRKLRLCFNCYGAFLSLEVKDAPLKNDVKAYIERWKKEAPGLN